MPLYPDRLTEGQTESRVRSPSYPDPWDAYKAYHAAKGRCLLLDKEIHDLDLAIVKQLREQKGLINLILDTQNKLKDDLQSVALIDFFQSALRRHEDSLKKVGAWLKLNRAKKAQLLVEFNIAARDVGEYQKDLWTCEAALYTEFRQLLENIDT